MFRMCVQTTCSQRKVFRLPTPGMYLSTYGLATDRTKVVARCEKAAAVAALQAQQDELSDHLQSTANNMKKSPGQFSATESQGDFALMLNSALTLTACQLCNRL